MAAGRIARWRFAIDNRRFSRICIVSGPKLLRNLELPTPARAKIRSSAFTPASAVFNPFGQIVTAIIRSKTELSDLRSSFVICVDLITFSQPLQPGIFDEPADSDSRERWAKTK